MKIKNDFKKLQEKSNQIEDKNKMNSTFKTGLDSKENETYKETKSGFYNYKKINNNFNNQDEFNSNPLEDNILKNKSQNIKKKLENRFINSQNLNDDSDKIKHFNTKGINIQTSNLDSHLNINVDKLNIKTVEEYLISKEKMDLSLNLLLKDLFDIDSKIEKMKAFMMNMRRNEMNRLCKEFNTKDYERRFKTTRSVVVSALIGEENTLAELSRQNREHKVSVII